MSNQIKIVSGDGSVEMISPDQIVGRECKHVVYTEAMDGSYNDLMLVKEQIHLKDKRIIPNVFTIENFKRPFFITKPGFRNHTDKKEFEDLDKVQMFKSTQIELGRNICRALGTAGGNLQLRQILGSQYVYGCDTTPPVLVKNMFQTKYPDVVSDNTVAALDIETDVVNGDGTKIILIALSFGSEKYVAGVKSFVSSVGNPIETFHAKVKEYVGEYVDNVNVEFELFDTPFECVQAVFKRAHQWRPDFISIWNMNFDLPIINRTITDAGWTLGEIYSDPCVPAKYRDAWYKEGKAQKVTATGAVMSVHPAERWHTMHCLSSFYFIDSMCVYKRIRVTGGNEPSYALDYILNKILGIRKLKFTQADHLTGLQWHQFLQKHYPIEYAVYNLFDTISLEELDAKTHDLSQTISLLTGHSEYSRFPSTPRRLSDDMEFFAQKHGRVFGTTGGEMVDALDKYVLGMNDWIVTLPSHLVVDNGIKCIKDIPTLTTLIRVHVADLDVAGAYPTTEDVMNISKETTYRELSRMEGIPEHVQRANSINLTGGHTNAMQFCNEIYGLPTATELIDLYRAERSETTQIL